MPTASSESQALVAPPACTVPPAFAEFPESAEPPAPRAAHLPQPSSPSLVVSIGVHASAVVLALRILYDLALKLRYELGGTYNPDTSMYWAVGRGILNGLKPWTDLMEDKPPGIFLLAAASVKWTGGLWLANIAQAVALGGMALLAFVIAWGRSPIALGRRTLPCALLIPPFLLLTLYVAERAGEVQAESYGAFFGTAYVAVLAWRRPIRRWVKWTLCAVCITGAVGFKEPYLFTLIAAVLIMRARVRDWISDFVVPMAISCVVCTIALAALGWFGSFVEYIRFMLTTHVGRFGSPLRRAADVWMLVADLNQYIPTLGWFVALLAAAALFSFLRREPAERRLFGAFRWTLSMYLMSLAVGVGGHYWAHHYAMAVPAYFALLSEILPDREATGTIRAPQALILPWALILTLAAPEVTWKELSAKLQSMHSGTNRAVASARYIDAFLDRIGDRRYTFLGPHFMQAYVWTRHSPYGPMFCQLPDFLESPKLRKAVLDEVDRTNLLAVHDMDSLGPELGGQVQERIDRDFDKEPPACLSGIPREPGMAYHYYFRKSLTLRCEQPPAS